MLENILLNKQLLHHKMSANERLQSKKYIHYSIHRIDYIDLRYIGQKYVHGVYGLHIFLFFF